ncbi:uncharacterized protein SETTUDRAFT_154174 [Exserohilum turcica Et28A]|uniref:Cytochrome P450 n=1 Tax=Exserohilum turcicum (strain 28A) TaxID=671987 RepID=R0K310_EXST2|nr:uncharacterized protein SETTUDRAFT_154174 [Exserohilum turcica Et28A]EOA87503.1 hypothetical protein SETTUDRAFT_154174 [Exserohilum turcica Et28A]
MKACINPNIFNLSTFLGLILAYLISISIYRIWFHPLSKYPGPLLCKLTSLVWTYHFIRGSILMWEQREHNSYGEIIRLGPNRLSFINPTAWKDIYGHKHGDAKPNVKNLDRAAKSMPSGRLPMALEPSLAGHAAQRKQFNPAFSEKAWRKQEVMVSKYIDQFIRRVREEIAKSPNGGAQLDFGKLYNFLTFDVMGDLTFGEGLGQLETGIESSWVHAVFVMYKLLNKRSVIKSYPFGGLLFDLFAPKGYLQDSAMHIKHCNALVSKRLEKSNEERPDIFGYVLNNSGEIMSRPLMNANANMLMVAGTETTATTLTAVTYLLINNPEKMKKLTLEVQAFSGISELTSPVLQKMRFLNAVIEEALRMYPVGQVGLGSQREIAVGGNVVCGQFLPGGTEVAVAAWAMNNSSLHWKDPDKFVPERWLPDELGFSEYHQYDNREAWLPFGTGPRTCIGKNMALHEIRGVLAKLVYCVDLLPPQENVDWLQNKRNNIWAKIPLDICVRLSK